MTAITAILRIVIGIVFGVLAAFALYPALAVIQNGAEDTTAPLIMLIITGISAALGFFALTIRNAFGRGFLFAGACLLALPLSALLLSVHTGLEYIADTPVDGRGFMVIFAGFGGILFTGVAAIIGLVLGGIFMVISLSLLRGGQDAPRIPFT